MIRKRAAPFRGRVPAASPVAASLLLAPLFLAQFLQAPPAHGETVAPDSTNSPAKPLIIHNVSGTNRAAILHSLGYFRDSSSFAGTNVNTTASQHVAYVARNSGARATLRFSVRDEEGNPVEGAEISVQRACESGGRPEYPSVTTDANGSASLDDIWQHYPTIGVRREGFYGYSHYLDLGGDISADGQRWLFDAVTEITLRRAVEPHPMLRRAVLRGDLPSRNGKVGYDVLKGDFTPPHGDGEATDFQILFYLAGFDQFSTDRDIRSIRLAVVPGKETRGFSFIEPVHDSFAAPVRSPASYGNRRVFFSSTTVTSPHDYTAAKIDEGRKIEARYYLFEARGRSGILKIDHFGYQFFDRMDGFSLRFLVNERPGETSLVATEDPDDYGLRPGEGGCPQPPQREGRASARPPAPPADLVGTAPRAVRDHTEDAPQAHPCRETGAKPADLLLATNRSGFAVFFGTAADGAFVPAPFADMKIPSMDGVKFLSIDDSVTEIHDSAFEGSRDLLSVELGGGLREIGRRAFADCPNLSLVFSDKLREFDMFGDSFSGAAPGLTCILKADDDFGFSMRRDVPPWARLVVQGKHDNNRSGGGFRFMDGDYLCGVYNNKTWPFDRESTYIAKYLGGPTNVLLLPESVGGMRNVRIGGSLKDAPKFHAVVIPERMAEKLSLQYGDSLDFGETNLPDMVISHVWPVSCGHGEKHSQSFVIGPTRGVSRVVAGPIELPPGTDPLAVAAGAVVTTNGFVALKRATDAVLLRYSGPGAARDEVPTRATPSPHGKPKSGPPPERIHVEVPAEIDGLPVTELGPHLFAGSGIREFALPSTLRKIGFCTFAGLKECETLEIPEGVEEIDAGAFFACLRLKSLVLPTTLRKVGYGAFEALPSAPALPPSAVVDDPFAGLK